MTGYLKKRFVAVLFAFVFLLPMLPAGATQTTRDQLREAEGRQRAAGARVSDQANLLAGTEFAMSEVMAELQALDQQITDALEALEIIERAFDQQYVEPA
jgi:hypothetical protein